MKVLHVITSLNRGGAETQLLTLCKEQLSEGWDVNVLSTRKDGDLIAKFQSVGVSVYTLDKKSFSPRNLYDLIRVINSKSFSVVHAHLPRAELMVRIALIGKQTCFFITRHNVEPFVPTSKLSLLFISTILSRWVTRKASCVIVISRAVKDFIYSRHEVSRLTKVSVVHYGYDTSNFRHKSKILKKNSDKYRIGTVARLVEQKNLSTLLQSVSLLRLPERQVELQIIGNGPKKKELLDLAKSLEIESLVTWTPNTEHRLEMMAEFDLFVLPSKYEGFGLVLLEAMQIGIPIVASRNTAIVELLGSGYVGFFDTGDFHQLNQKILEFFSFSPIDKSCLIDYYSERLKLFAPKKMATKVLSEYRYCLSGSEFVL